MRNVLERTLVIAAQAIFNALYRFFCLFSRKREILFVSRQANAPSHDFSLLGREFERRGYKPVYLTQKLSKKTVIKYVIHVVAEVYHLARCEACFLDRYDPVIGLMRFKSINNDSRVGAERVPLHDRFPVEPIIVQIWHAFGAFKKFGYQSCDTLEGHARSTLELYNVHANYSWILCSGEECRPAYAEAFGYPQDRVAVLHRPEYDELKELRKISPSALALNNETGVVGTHEYESSSAVRRTVLFAPTLRKDRASDHPFQELCQGGEWECLNNLALVEWSFHPLEASGVASGEISNLLQGASVVVTDYSSIAYEAYLLEKAVLFYVSDIDQYRISPGLNTDPLIECPQITFIDKKELLEYIASLLDGAIVYPREALRKFASKAIDEHEENATEKLVDTTIAWVVEAGRWYD